MGDKTIKSYNIFSRNQQKIQKKHHSCMLAILTEVSLLQLARRWCWGRGRGQNWSRVTVASCQASTCRRDQGEPASAPGADILLQRIQTRVYTPGVHASRCTAPLSRPAATR